MRILLDLQAAQESHHRGIGRWSLSFAKALIDNSSHEYWLLFNAELVEGMTFFKEELSAFIPQSKILYFYPVSPTDGRDPENDNRRTASIVIWRSLVANINPDIVWASGAFAGGSFIPMPPICDPRWILAITTYDLIPLINEDKFLVDPRLRRAYSHGLDSIKQSDILLAISESSRQEVLDHVPQVQPARIFAISSASSSFFHRLENIAETESTLSAHHIVRPFVLCIGSEQPHKNLPGLLRAFSSLSATLLQQYQFVVVLADIHDDFRDKLKRIASNLTGANLLFVKKATDVELLHLYNACKLFILPSCHEGFGLPALEAMQCGAAVITSNQTSLPEIVKWEDAMFDPFSTEDMCLKISAALQDRKFYAALLENSERQSKRFSWKQTAQSALHIFENSKRKLVETNGSQIRVENRKCKLAYVSPISPDTSGIAGYTADLVPYLTKYYEIDIITRQDQSTKSWLPANITLRSPEWFERHYDDYDRVIYQIGNSPSYSYMFDLLCRRPGIVVLHDFYLSSAFKDYESSDANNAEWSKELWRSHGWQAFVKTRETQERRQTWPCNRFVFQQAVGVIAHTLQTKKLAFDFYNRQEVSRIEIVTRLTKMRARRRPIDVRKKLGLQDDAFVCVTTDSIHTSNSRHKILESWRKIKHDLPSAILVILDTSSCFGPSNEVVELPSDIPRGIVAGRVHNGQYWDYLEAADISVQLCDESYGAVLDALAIGLPTITTSDGAMVEFPDGIVLKLAGDYKGEELTNAILNLARNPAFAQEIGQRGTDHIARFHHPESCASSYKEAIEKFYNETKDIFILSVVDEAKKAFRSLGDSRDLSLYRQISRAVARSNQKVCQPPRLLYDLTCISQNDPKTGIQRVVKNVLDAYLADEWEGRRTELVAISKSNDLYYPHEYACRRYGSDTAVWKNEEVILGAEDIYLCVDLLLEQQSSHLWKKTLHGAKATYYCIYDLLPLRMPSYFSSGMSSPFKNWIAHLAAYADGLICISKAVADDLYDYLKSSAVKRKRSKPLNIGYFHLGADFTRDISDGSTGLNDSMRQKLASGPVVLMVSTIEPRKGYAQALHAMEILWQRGSNVNFVIVGKRGWLVDQLLSELDHHPEKDRRLFWFEGASDQTLIDLYEIATCILAASEGEGFGLPLIEAAEFGKPILCRDLAVFKEVAGSHATYFSGFEPDDLAKAIDRWMSDHASGIIISSNEMPRLSWKQSAAQLRDVILQDNWLHQW